MGQKAEEAVKELAQKAAKGAQPVADDASKALEKGAKGAKAAAQSLGEDAEKGVKEVRYLFRCIAFHLCSLLLTCDRG